MDLNYEIARLQTELEKAQVIQKLMTITLQAKWEIAEVRRGLNIYRRLPKTGTSQGRWLTAVTYFPSRKRAQAYVDSMPDSLLNINLNAQNAVRAAAQLR